MSCTSPNVLHAGAPKQGLRAIQHFNHFAKIALRCAAQVGAGGLAAGHDRRRPSDRPRPGRSAWLLKGHGIVPDLFGPTPYLLNTDRDSPAGTLRWHGLSEVTHEACRAARFTPREELQTPQISAGVRLATAGMGAMPVLDNAVPPGLEGFSRPMGAPYRREMTVYARSAFLASLVAEC